MKRLAVISVLTIGLLLAGLPRRADAYVHVGVSVGFFYNELAPYGTWVDCAYGEAWVPAALPGGWQPYSNGEWVWTDYGWTWVSYDPWGGDPFHYGSWTWLDPWGWAWVPGTVWAPAWVTWCDSGDYIGWAPLSPTFAFAATGYYGVPVVCARATYVFVPSRHMAGTSVARFRVPVARNAALVGRGRSLTSFRVSGGVLTNTALPVTRVGAAMGRSVPHVSIRAARTDPRPLPSGVAGRMRVAASPSVVRAELAGRPIGHPGRTIQSHVTSYPRRGVTSRPTVITNHGAYVRRPPFHATHTVNRPRSVTVNRANKFTVSRPRSGPVTRSTNGRAAALTHVRQRPRPVMPAAVHRVHAPVAHGFVRPAPARHAPTRPPKKRPNQG